MQNIHPTAIVDSRAELADGVSVGPYAIIGPNVKAGPNCVIYNHATVTGFTTLGANVQVHPGAVVGGPPQDLKYKGERTTLDIGDNSVIRECCTLHLGTDLGGGSTVVGKNNLIMAYTHIAHDCKLGNNIVIANGAQLAGHVHVQDGARISGLVAVHHFVTIGTCSFIAGCAKLSIDVPPFTLAEGHPARIKALNKEGMKRRGMSPELQAAFKECFRFFFRKKIARDEAMRQIESAGYLSMPEIAMFVEFLQATERGAYGRALEHSREVVPPEQRDGKLNFKIGESDDDDDVME